HRFHRDPAVRRAPARAHPTHPDHEEEVLMRARRLTTAAAALTGAALILSACSGGGGDSGGDGTGEVQPLTIHANSANTYQRNFNPFSASVLHGARGYIYEPLVAS